MFVGLSRLSHQQEIEIAVFHNIARNFGQRLVVMAATITVMDEGHDETVSLAFFAVVARQLAAGLRHILPGMSPEIDVVGEDNVMALLPRLGVGRG